MLCAYFYYFYFVKIQIVISLTVFFFFFSTVFNNTVLNIFKFNFIYFFLKLLVLGEVSPKEFCVVKKKRKSI